MIRRLGPAPGKNTAPLWVWSAAQGRGLPRPDLRRSGWGKPGERLYLLELEVSSEGVLLSDHQKWHLVLDQEYVPATLSEADDWEMEIGAMQSSDVIAPQLQRRLRQSWERIFVLDDLSDAWGSPETREVQGTVWKLALEWLENVTCFTAR